MSSSLNLPGEPPMVVMAYDGSGGSQEEVEDGDKYPTKHVPIM